MVIYFWNRRPGETILLLPPFHNVSSFHAGIFYFQLEKSLLIWRKDAESSINFQWVPLYSRSTAPDALELRAGCIMHKALHALHKHTKR